MAWESYAEGALALAALDLLVTSVQNNGPAKNLGTFVGSTLPALVNRILSPTVPFFGAGSLTNPSAKTTSQQSGSSGTTLVSYVSPITPLTMNTGALA